MKFKKIIIWLIVLILLLAEGKSDVKRAVKQWYEDYQTKGEKYVLMQSM